MFSKILRPVVEPLLKVAVEDTVRAVESRPMSGGGWYGRKVKCNGGASLGGLRPSASLRSRTSALSGRFKRENPASELAVHLNRPAVGQTIREAGEQVAKAWKQIDKALSHENLVKFREVTKTRQQIPGFSKVLAFSESQYRNLSNPFMAKGIVMDGPTAKVLKLYMAELELSIAANVAPEATARFLALHSLALESAVTKLGEVPALVQKCLARGGISAEQAKGALEFCELMTKYGTDALRLKQQDKLAFDKLFVKPVRNLLMATTLAEGVELLAEKGKSSGAILQELNKALDDYDEVVAGLPDGMDPERFLAAAMSLIAVMAMETELVPQGRLTDAQIAAMAASALPTNVSNPATQPKEEPAPVSNSVTLSLGTMVERRTQAATSEIVEELGRLPGQVVAAAFCKTVVEAPDDKTQNQLLQSLDDLFGQFLTQEIGRDFNPVEHGSRLTGGRGAVLAGVLAAFDDYEKVCKAHGLSIGGFLHTVDPFGGSSTEVAGT